MYMGVASLDYGILWYRILVSHIDEGVGTCVIIGLECVCYLVYNFVMSD